MAVLIRRVTCKSFFFLLGTKKSLKLRNLPSRTSTLFLSRRSACQVFCTATKSATVLQNFQVNLHFTHYAQGKYDDERKFMCLEMFHRRFIYF